MADLDALALAPPADDEGGLRRRAAPRTKANAKTFVFHRSRRPDAIDPVTGERLDDVLMFRVENLRREGDPCSPTTAGFTSRPPTSTATRPCSCGFPTWRGSTTTSSRSLVVEAWLTRAHKRVAKAWLAEHQVAED